MTRRAARGIIEIVETGKARILLYNTQAPVICLRPVRQSRQLTDNGCIAFRSNSMKLGKLCKRNHEYENTGKSMRDVNNQCLACKRAKYAEQKSIPEFKAKLLNRWRDYKERCSEKVSESRKAYREKNKDALRKKAIDAYHRDQERSSKLAKERRERKPELYRRIGRESRRRLRENNPEKSRENAREYYKQNTVKVKLRSRVYKAFKIFSTNGKTMPSDEYGIDYAAIISHLGECPGSQREWHIDHIRPLALFDFSDPEQIKLAFSPSNHQWLPAKDNLIKGSRVKS